MLAGAGGREQAVTSAVCCWPQQDSAMGVRGMNKWSCNSQSWRFEPTSFRLWSESD